MKATPLVVACSLVVATGAVLLFMSMVGFEEHSMEPPVLKAETAELPKQAAIEPLKAVVGGRNLRPRWPGSRPHDAGPVAAMVTPANPLAGDGFTERLPSKNTLAVWTHGYPDFEGSFEHAVLQTAFPDHDIVIDSLKRGTLNVAVVRPFYDRKHHATLPPAGVPHIRATMEAIMDTDFPAAGPMIASISSIRYEKQAYRPTSVYSDAPYLYWGQNYTLDAHHEAMYTREFYVPYAVRGRPYGALQGLLPSLRAEEYSTGFSQRPMVLGYINSHCTPEREHFFAAVRSHFSEQRTVAGGKCGKSAGEKSAAWAGKHNGVSPKLFVARQSVASPWFLTMMKCKFVIAMENHHWRIPGYITEKVMQAFMVGAIPVVLGDEPQLSLLFNPDAYFQVANYPTVEAAAEAFIHLAEDDAAVAAMRAAPVLQPSATQFFDWKVGGNMMMAYKELVDVVRQGVMDGNA